MGVKSALRRQSVASQKIVAAASSQYNSYTQHSSIKHTEHFPKFFKSSSHTDGPDPVTVESRAPERSPTPATAHHRFSSFDNSAGVKILHQSDHWFIQSYLIKGASQEVVPALAFACRPSSSDGNDGTFLEL
jgi:hypothetical protein